MHALLLQPAAPSLGKVTDQGLIIVVFMLLIGCWLVWLLFNKGPTLIAAWRGGNGHKATAEALADLEAQQRVLTTQVERCCASYHDRLVPDLHALALAALRREGMGDLAELERKRVAALEEKRAEPHSAR